jgi:chitodextrinase
VVACDTIPLVSIESMSIGAFLDTTVAPKETYWYKVVGIDQSGNEAPLAKAAPISTFTFTTATPPVPAVISVTATTATPFGLLVRWTPAFDPAAQRGFAVFRSDHVDGLYRQVGTLLNAAEYQDNNVVRGATYWYRVLAMDRSGQVSALSPPTSGSLPPSP